jgi:hypothetical protein
LSNLGSFRISGRSGSDRVGFRVVQVRVRVSDCLILGHLGFLVVRDLIMSGFGLFDLISSSISGHSGPDRVSLKNQVGSGSGPSGSGGFFGSGRILRPLIT